MSESVEPARHLDLEGAYNIRDIGGYPTLDGRQTRWRTFLRADTLRRLPPSSQTALFDYGIRTVVDLRGTDELRDGPNVFAQSAGVAYHHLNMMGDDPLAGPADPSEPQDPFESYLRLYRLILDRRHPRICETIATLARPGAAPAIYHCNGGKDRTGLITALLLGVARVSDEIIAEDYGLTARYLVRRAYDADPELKARGYTWQDYQREACPPGVMLRTLEHLRERYGGVEGYLLGCELGRETIERLRAALVE